MAEDVSHEYSKYSSEYTVYDIYFMYRTPVFQRSKGKLINVIDMLQSYDINVCHKYWA